MNRSLTLLSAYFQTLFFRKFRDREQLGNWQNQQVQQFLKQVLPKSPFYQNYYQGLSFKDWRTFPQIDKSKMMDNFDNLNTVGIQADEAFKIAINAEKTRNFQPNLKGYTVGLSTGTSGNRGLFLVSPTEQAIWAGTVLAKALPNFILTPQRIAFFLRANSRLYQTVKSQHIQFEFFDLLLPLSNHLHRLNDYQPTILVAPASLLKLLAKAKLQNQLNINPVKIISVAEVLDPLDSQFIQEAFQQTVHQIYQCTEGFLGITCAYGTLHLNEDFVVIQKEYLDAQKTRFIPIITDFRRTTQPIIRYRLDDILVEHQNPCPCGSVFISLEQIEGRQDDLFYLPHFQTQKLIPIFPDFIRRAIVIADSRILDYTAIQTQIHTIKIYLKVDPNVQNNVKLEIKRSLTSLFQKMQCCVPQILFPTEQFDREPHQKRRRIQRTWKIHQGFG